MENPQKPNPAGLKVHYQKTSSYRNVYVSGAFGGASLGNKMVYMSLFTDRPPIPKVILSQIEGGEVQASKDEILEVKDGVVREVEIGCIMDLKTAKALVQWLQHKVNVLEGKT